jgi:hypothetical protein
MTFADDAKRHLFGAWRLLCWDPAGLDHFDLSDRGFYRSFGAIGAAFLLLVVVFVADHRTNITLAQDAPDVTFAVPLAVYVAIEMFLAVLGYAVFVFLMMPLARGLGAEARYAAYVLVYNWTSFLVVLIAFGVAALQLGGVVPWDFALAAQFILAFVFLLYGWFVAQMALGLSRMDAAAVVALETLVFLILTYPATALYAGYSGTTVQ